MKSSIAVRWLLFLFLHVLVLGSCATNSKRMTEYRGPSNNRSVGDVWFVASESPDMVRIAPSVRLAIPSDTASIKDLSFNYEVAHDGNVINSGLHSAVANPCKVDIGCAGAFCSVIGSEGTELQGQCSSALINIFCVCEIIIWLPPFPWPLEEGDELTVTIRPSKGSIPKPAEMMIR